MPKFQKGGKGKLIIPSNMAYGRQSQPGIPKNSILVFDVALLDWE
jgi:FKBP-type peptidyl-prolyl cis-trans isomerase